MTREEFSRFDTTQENNSCSRKSKGGYGVEFISSGKVSSSLCLAAPLPFFRRRHPIRPPLLSVGHPDIGKYADQLNC